MSTPIRLVVVDDSAFVRKALQRVFQSNREVEVVAMAGSGEELLEHFEEWRPDAVTLDLSMPGIGGLATLDRLIAVRPIPVIILSSHSSVDAPLTLEALSRGAADFVDKEEFSLVDFESIRTVLLCKLRAVMNHPSAADDNSECQIRTEPILAAATFPPDSLPRNQLEPGLMPDVVVIGASTGGPPAIEQILSQLPAAPPVPIVIVQHMPSGFTKAFAQRLDGKLSFSVREASHGAPVLAGTVYIAPGGTHLRLQYQQGRLSTALSRYPETPHRPSVDVLFRSVASLPLRVVGILLTGMGNDGAHGLLELNRNGALTIAQDEATSVVYGMPRCANDLGAVREQLPLLSIGQRLNDVIGLSSPHRN